MAVPPLWHPSPNFGPRRGGARPSLVVLHATAMADCAGALARLCDPAAEVSAHYLISETGQIWQMVDEAQRAWHAGAGSWGPITDVNSHAIGIELANPMTHPFPEPQMMALEALLGEVLDRHGICPARVIAHSDMAPGRKSDPGPRFDWRRLARQGLSIWPDPVASEAALDTLLKEAGYPANVTPEEALAAFRLRFRPGASGPETAADRALAAGLAARFPFDAGRGRA